MVLAKKVFFIKPFLSPTREERRLLQVDHRSGHQSFGRLPRPNRPVPRSIRSLGLPLTLRLDWAPIPAPSCSGGSPKQADSHGNSSQLEESS